MEEDPHEPETTHKVQGPSTGTCRCYDRWELLLHLWLPGPRPWRACFAFFPFSWGGDEGMETKGGWRGGK